MEIFIAGKGIITSIGNNVTETLDSLKNSKTGVGEITILPTGYRGKLPAAEVKYTNQQLSDITGLDISHSRTTLLSLIAAREAIADAAIPDFNKYKVGFISANTVGGMDKTENIFKEYLEDSTTLKLTETAYHDSGASTEVVAEQLGIKHHISTISTACSSSANAIMYGARLIKSHQLDIAVCGGTDSFSRFTLNGFNSLMILDSEPCKPYDENRKGLNLGEGAAYVILVSEKVAATLSKKPTTKLSGYENANDAFHQTASSPEGKGNYMAMSGALRMSRLKPEHISYINLHGTGTSNNDLSEGVAIEQIFGTQIPPVSSTKPFTGHTLGACAAVEAVFSILCIEQGIILPHLRFKNKMKELNFEPCTQYLEQQEVTHVMSNSFGFGGNCSSLIFSKA
jgi:3-oxoacyl-(acyl-carrier-protein) synthase